MLFFILLFSFFIPEVSAQPARIVTLEHPVYTPLNRLQQRGYLDGLNPTHLPWSLGEIAFEVASIDEVELTNTELAWLDQVRDWIASASEKTTGVQVQLGGFQSNYLRNDLLRPGFSANGPMPNGALQIFFARDQFAAQTGLVFDRYYDRDPDGLDIARRLMSRSENQFLAYQNEWFSARWGRFKESWTGFGLPGVLLSENPAAFDHLSLRFGNETFSVASLVGELDMLAPDGSFRTRDRFVNGGIRRFAAMHRVDWNPRKNLQFSAFEGVLYSSPSAGFSLQYANPVSVFVLESDNDPKNYENNLLLGFSGRGRWKKVTIQGQMVFDDGVYENRRWRAEAGELEPASVARMFSVYWADVLPNADVSFLSHAVSNLSYRTDQMEGQWSYAQRGLASNFSDFKQQKVKMSWHAQRFVHGLTVSPYLDRLLQGEGDFRLPLANDGNDAGNAPQFFQGVTEKTIRLGMEIVWMPTWNLNLKADAGVNLVKNRFHLEGKEATLFAGLFSVSWRLER